LTTYFNLSKIEKCELNNFFAVGAWLDYC